MISTAPSHAVLARAPLHREFVRPRCAAFLRKKERGTRHAGRLNPCPLLPPPVARKHRPLRPHRLIFSIPLVPARRPLCRPIALGSTNKLTASAAHGVPTTSRIAYPRIGGLLEGVAGPQPSPPSCSITSSFTADKAACSVASLWTSSEGRVPTLAALSSRLLSQSGLGLTKEPQQGSTSAELKLGCWNRWASIQERAGMKKRDVRSTKMSHTVAAWSRGATEGRNSLKGGGPQKLNGLLPRRVRRIWCGKPCRPQSRNQQRERRIRIFSR